MRAGGWICVEAAINENRAGRQTNHLLSIIAKVTFFSLQHPGGGIKNMEIPCNSSAISNVQRDNNPDNERGN